MPIQKQSYQIQGMRQDNLVATSNSSKFAHEIMNMRLNTIGDYTSASWTTEKGTKQIINIDKDKEEFPWFGDYGFNNKNLTDLQPIGQANINNTWVLFLTDTTYQGDDEDPNHLKDYIITLRYNNDNLVGNILFRGNLKFDYNYPIETLTFFENEQIQKVYWVDGKNQPRVINILDNKIKQNISTQFDFVQEVSLNEDIEVNKLQLGQGIFPPGSVRYAITYYRKYGAETNIVWTSPLYYPTIGDRACNPDEISGDSFKITVKNFDKEHNFDFIRLYSIIRTSDNATPIVRIVEDRFIDENLTEIEFIDNNTKGEIVDPAILQYIGGNIITAYTLDQKDNTLFLGNIELKQKSLASLKLSLGNTGATRPIFDNTENIKLIPYKKFFNIRLVGNNIPQSLTPTQDLNAAPTFFYTYHNEMNPATLVTNNDINPTYYTYHGNSYDFKIFKTGEIYRFGIQAQNINGVWSDVVYLKDEKFKINPAPNALLGYYKVGYAKYTISSNNVNKLYSAGYRRVRLVCCYPNIGERRVLAQGIISPTIQNIKEADSNTATNSPKYQASWFFRSNTPDDFSKEIYSYVDSPSNNDSIYRRTSNVLTLNSPDIELDETIRTLDLINSSVNLVGTANLIKYTNAIYLDSGMPAYNSLGVQNVGLTNNKKQGTLNGLNNYHYVKDFAIWNDCNVYYYWNDNDSVKYPIFPFHRNSSLNNYIKKVSSWTLRKRDDDNPGDDIEIKQTAKLESKVMSYLGYSDNTVFNNDTPLNASVLQWFDSTEVTPVLLGADVYYGNVNTIAYTLQLPTKWDDLEDNYTSTIDQSADTGSGGYHGKLETIGPYNIKRISGDDLSTDFIFPGGSSGITHKLFAADPVPLTYKSTPHLVFKSNNLDYEESSKQYLYIAELTRNDVSRNNSAYTDIYLPCGPSVKIPSNGQPCTVYGLEGDSYLMRYDCLKTYPYTTEDVNQIVEIASIMCESRINLDGRYDRNRGLADNTTILPTNFNLINKSYTQTDNLFSYFRLDEDDATLDKFNNQFTWSKTKVSGENTDAWTNVTLASTADANGTLGKITKIINLNDTIYLFQDHGIAQIGFNEKTALSTEVGVPLEIANSGKYTGLNYLSTEIGCQNKWSLSCTKNGLFFIDDSRQELLVLNEGFSSLSTANGFDAFMIKQLPSTFKIWNPVDFDNFVTYYDKLSNDIYYINKNTCLAWNEQSKTFTSFYNYENVPYMTNIGFHSLMWNNGIYAARESTDYSVFFNNTKDYWMTIVCDGQTNDGSAFPADKVFNNIEYRADIFNVNYDIADNPHTNYNNSVFNKKHAWNGYQDSQEVALDGERKFNTWRVQLPRHYGTRDRIRNPFCYIKLKQNQSVTQQTDRVILHDLAVYFDMK